MVNHCFPLHYSRLADQADLVELIDLFVAELPERLADMQAAFERGDRELLRTLAHQLKGAGGSHGFDSLTPAAQQLEQAVRSGQSAEQIGSALHSLNEIAQAVRAGQPE
jgi:HPt (histidine-containing phosphotransfer) domain-containing protein